MGEFSPRVSQDQRASVSLMFTSCTSFSKATVHSAFANRAWQPPFGKTPPMCHSAIAHSAIPHSASPYTHVHSAQGHPDELRRTTRPQLPDETMPNHAPLTNSAEPRFSRTTHTPLYSMPVQTNTGPTTTLHSQCRSSPLRTKLHAQPNEARRTRMPPGQIAPAQAR